MFIVKKVAENRVDIELNGALDAASMARGLDELIEASEDVRAGRMLYRISEFALPTLGAFGVEMSRLSSLIKLIGKFDRCAVMTDAGWLKKAAEIEGALFPGIDIKSFDLHDDDAAEAWLAS